MENEYENLESTEEGNGSSLGIPGNSFGRSHNSSNNDDINDRLERSKDKNNNKKDDLNERSKNGNASKNILHHDDLDQKKESIFDNFRRKRNNQKPNKKKIEKIATAVDKFKKALKAIQLFFATPLGMAVLFIGFILTLIILVCVILAMVVNSLGMKYGLTGEETLKVFNDKYEEGMSIEDLDELMEEAEDEICTESFLDRIRHFFNFWDLSDSCELAHYVKRMLKVKEEDTGIEPISPGFVLSSLYYAYDTQNMNEEGMLYIKPTDKEYFSENSSAEDFDMVNDLDAITTLMEVKIYEKEDLDKLLDMYIFHDYYPYWRWEWVYPPGYPQVPAYQDCVYHLKDSYRIDVNKLKLYLRYGYDGVDGSVNSVVNAYTYDTNRAATHENTSRQCKHFIDFDKPGLGKYSTKANVDSSGDDEASISIPESGSYSYSDNDHGSFNAGTYEYIDGFIFKTYPRYDERFIIGNEVTYDYLVDKDIEQIIENIESRQDYINYVLGYPSDIPTTDTLLGSSSNNNFSSGAICKFNLNGKTVSDIKVRLLHARNNDAVPGVGSYEPIAGQELVDFDKYVLGVTYGENGAAPFEALKTQAVAVASYILSNAKPNGYINLVEENGQTIIEISSSTFHQVYCDPDKGCDMCISPSNDSIVTVLTKGTVPPGSSCKHYRDASPAGSDIRKAVSAVSGMVLVNSSGDILSTQYTSKIQNNWNSMANSGKDYIEILRSTYGSEYQVSTPDCSYGASGEWASWRQYTGPWANMLVGSTSNYTMYYWGCFITSHAMMLAKSGQPLTIKDFNPGTYLTLIKNSGCVSASADTNGRCAVQAAVGHNNFEYGVHEFDTNDYNKKVEKIGEYLSQGYEIILRVKSPQSVAIIQGSSYEHWVYVTGLRGNSILMADPASNATVVLDKYINEGIVAFKYIKF